MLAILLAPLVLALCYLLPLLGTVHATEQPTKWAVYWIVQIAANYTGFQLLSLILEQ